MQANNNAFDLRQSINGDSVVGFTSIKEMKTLGWLDAPKVSTYLMGDKKRSHTKYLGLINLFNTSHKRPFPLMADLLKSAAVLEVEEGQSITYDLPVSEEAMMCMTIEDTSGDTDYPGIDEGYFRLVLTHEFTKGDILTYDLQFGEQVIVSSEHEVERRGENFLYYVQLMTMDREAYFPKEFLKPGVAWIKVDHPMAEYDTVMSGLNMLKSPGGTITNEYYLSSPRAIQTFYTAKAAKMRPAGLVEYTTNARERATAALDNMGGDKREIMFFSRMVNGNIQKPDMVGYTLEYLALMELALMESHSLQFARPATIQSSNGVKRVNEGVWHQIRRGKIIKYAKPGGIKLDDLTEAANYIFRNSDMSPKDRKIKFRAGSFAYQNVLEIFREYAISQLNGLPAGMLGYDKQVSGTVFQGPLDDLKMQWIAITGVFLPGVGTVDIEWDPAMDYLPNSDRLNAGMFGEGKAWTTWSLVIWDATDSQYSNVGKEALNRVRGASLVEGGTTRSNIYYVKPQGPSITWGYQQGRMADGDQNSDIRSSIPYMGREFWAISQSSALVLDTTRYVTIELQR